MCTVTRLFLLVSLLACARSWSLIRRGSITSSHTSGSVLFGNLRSPERDHSLAGIEEMKVAGGDSETEAVKSRWEFVPWKRLVVALDRVPEQKLSYLLLPGRGMFTQTLSWFTLFTALSMIVRSSIFSGSNLVGKLEQIVSNSNSKGMMIVLCSLASSCCYIQLALNAFSIGCAGLNSYFGPMRPFFLGLTAVVQEAVWRQALAAGASRGRLVASSVATAMLSLLPEILYFYQSLRRRWKRMLLTSYLQQDGAIPSSTTTNTATRNVTNISNEGNYVSYTLRTQGMGCVACTQKIQKIVDRLPFIVESSINIENGIVTVKTLGSSDMWHEDIKQLCVALSHQGYPSNIIRTNHYDWSLL